MTLCQKSSPAQEHRPATRIGKGRGLRRAFIRPAAEWPIDEPQWTVVTTTTSSPDYKLYALPGEPPHRPGLVRVERNEQGAAIEVEVWELPAREFGSFVAGIPAPLGIGTITLRMAKRCKASCASIMR